MTKSLKTMFKAIVALTMVLSLVGGSAVASASALTSAQVSAIVSLLQSFGADATTVANVTASLNGLPTTGSTASAVTTSGYTFAKSLTIGSTGADVTALQNLLQVSPATGYFGAITKAALIKYQIANGIVASATTGGAGLFGPKTIAFVNAHATGTVSSTTGTGSTVSAGTVGGALAVSLAATSPITGSVIAGQAAADLAEYTFTNNSATASTVTNITLQRGGVSADTALANVYLFNGATRLTDAATVSSGQVTFNSAAGLFTVAPGSSVTISVKADIAKASNSGQTINLSLTNVSATPMFSVSYPLAGAFQTITSAGDLAGVTLTPESQFANTASQMSINAGTVQNAIWGAVVQTSQRAVYLKSLAIKIIGSIPSNSLTNIGLFASGVKIATATGIDSNGLLTFVPTTAGGYSINGSVTLEVRADIVNGSSRSFTASLQNAADLQIVDSNYNVGITYTLGNTSNTGALSTPQINILSGSLSASLDSSLGSGNVVYGSTGVDLAHYALTGYGEDEKISYLDVAATQDLSNVTLLAGPSLSSLVSISSAQNISSSTEATNGVQFSLGSSLIVPAGTTEYLVVRGDLKNANGNDTATTSQVYVNLIGVSGNAEGSYSSSLTTFPTSPVQGPTLTVVGAGLSVSQNSGFQNLTYTANSANTKIGSFTLTANSSEAVNLTGVTVTLAQGSGYLPLTSLSNLYVSVNNTKQQPQSTGNNFSVSNVQIPANGYTTVDVFADVGALPSTQTYSGTLTVSAAGTASTTIAGVSIGAYDGGSASTAAAALAVAINGHSNICGTTAVANGATITLTSSSSTITVLPGALTSVSNLNGSLLKVNNSSTQTIKTSLSVTANGATSNSDASVSGIAGQLTTVGNGTLNMPTLTSNTPAVQYVLGGTTGNNFADYGFTSNVGNATITELGFSIPTNAASVQSITVGGVTVPATASTTISGLNISVPYQASPTEVKVVVAFNQVAAAPYGNVTSAATTTLVLTHVKYLSGSNQLTIEQPGSPITTSAVSQLPVAAYPAITFIPQSSNNFTSNTQLLLGQVSVTINNGNTSNQVNLRQIPISITGNGVSLAGAQLTLADQANTNVTLASSTNAGDTATAVGTVGTNYLSFNGTGGYSGYSMTGTKVFNLYANVTASSTASNLGVQLGGAGSVVWDDIQGGAAGLTATLLPSYNSNNTTSTFVSAN
jgi:hypothetical protein